MKSSQPDNEEPAGIDFLDFLFTVAISVGMTPEVVGRTGLMSQAWHENATWPSVDEWFDIGVFLLGFFNLTLSWFGYHASINKKPLNYSSPYGMARFNIDVVLVVLYLVMLVEFNRFSAVVSILLIVHFIFVVWDYLKIREHPDKYPGDSLWRFRREWVSVFAFLFVIVTTVLHFCFHANHWIILAMSLFITVFYRINKYRPTWEFLVGYSRFQRDQA